MQNLHGLVSASLLALSLGTAAGFATAPQEQETETPYVSPQARRQAKLEQELLGTWMLTDYQAPDKLFEGRDRLSGWLMIRDGYLSWSTYGSEEVARVFGNERKANLESILYRYRVSATQELQMASLVGFSDLPGSDGVVFDDGHNALGYDVVIDSRTMTLNNPGVETFTFRRMGTSSFPERAIRALETQTDFDPLSEGR